MCANISDITTASIFKQKGYVKMESVGLPETLIVLYLPDYTLQYARIGHIIRLYISVGWRRK
jgi:hypothetical protein